MALPEISPYIMPNVNRVVNPAITNPVVNPLLPVAPIKTKVDRVKGLEGANAYPIAPDSSIIVVDEELPVVWFIATDSTGNKTVVQGYKLEAYTPPKPVTLEDLMAEMRDMKQRLIKVEEVSENVQSNRKPDVESKPAYSNTQPSNEYSKSNSNGKSYRNDDSGRRKDATGN